MCCWAFWIAVCFFFSSVHLFSLVFIFSIIFIQLTASSKSLTTNCRCSRDKFQQLIYVIHIQLPISCAMLNTYENAFIANLLFKYCCRAKNPCKIACIIIIQIKCTNSSERKKTDKYHFARFILWNNLDTLTKNTRRASVSQFDRMRWMCVFVCLHIWSNKNSQPNNRAANYRVPNACPWLIEKIT